jgi:hypothetical protein
MSQHAACRWRVPASVSDELSRATDRDWGRGCCPELVEHALLVEGGDPVEAIRRAGAGLDADLAIIGPRGPTGLKRVLLGSVADAASRTLECDVHARVSTARRRTPDRALDGTHHGARRPGNMRAR